MNATFPWASILAVLIALPFVGAVAPAATISIIQTFDFPPSADAVSATLPQKVSHRLDVTGTVMFLGGRARAFAYKIRITKFSPPLNDPNDTGFVTRGRGINNLRHIVGEYLNGVDGTYRGYKLFYPDFMAADIPGAVETMPLRENNAGNFVGSRVLSDGTQPAFVSARGRFTLFSVPGAVATFTSQLNTAGEIVGYYVDPDNVSHGCVRDSLENPTYPVDVPGATQTALSGNNDWDWGIGRYAASQASLTGCFT